MKGNIMSSNSWSICPKCKVTQIERKERLRKKMAISYGKISAEGYQKLYDEVTKPIELNEQTLRADYDIKTDEDGFFEVVYSAVCTECDFKFKFSSTKQVV